MDIAVNGKVVFTLSENDKRVILHNLKSENFEEDLIRRLTHGWQIKYEPCLNRLKNEWLPKLAAKYSTVPTDENALLNLIFNQEDYKNRDQRDAEDAVRLAEENARVLAQQENIIKEMAARRAQERAELVKEVMDIIAAGPLGQNIAAKADNA